MLSIKNLRATVEGKEILTGINLEVNRGEIHAIMGPNGSGKSTLANALMGNPNYQVKAKKMEIDNKNIKTLRPNERAEKGMFLANQNPVMITGLGIQSFLWQMYKKRRDDRRMPVIEFRNWVKKQVKRIGMSEELLERDLNDGFSGGEKKKLEILQMLVANPKYLILDEIDSGLDIDALKKIAQTIEEEVVDKKMGVIVITHYSRVLKFLKPDRIHVIQKGRITRSGGEEMLDEIEDKGFDHEV